jgi:hypothetical protein
MAFGSLTQRERRAKVAKDVKMPPMPENCPMGFCCAAEWLHLCVAGEVKVWAHE